MYRRAVQNATRVAPVTVVLNLPAMNRQMAQLREVLYADPSPEAWEALCALFDTWGPEGLELAVAYAEGFLREWPTWLREPPRGWGWDLPHRRLAHDLGESELAALAAETSIVWREDLEPLDYVRERWVPSARPGGPVRVRNADRLVGYAEVAPRARPDGVDLANQRVHTRQRRAIRRIFTLREYDRDSDPDGVMATSAPREAVDPRTVSAGVLGWNTPRLEGRASGPLSARHLALSAHGLAWDHCTACGLHAGRTHVVTGSGAARRRVVLVSDSPTAEDDARGLPFVGRERRLVSLVLDTLGLSRHDVMMTYLVACHARRFPREREIAACATRLQAEFELADPTIIIALGDAVARVLLGLTDSDLLVRGRWYPMGDAELMPTLSLQRALDHVRERHLLWGDLQAVRGRLETR